MKLLPLRLGRDRCPHTGHIRQAHTGGNEYYRDTLEFAWDESRNSGRWSASRLAEETSVRPKPLVEIGEKPILWHIMNIYAHHGLSDFHHLRRLQGLYAQGIFHKPVPASQRHHRRPGHQRDRISQGLRAQLEGDHRRVRHELHDGRPYPAHPRPPEPGRALLFDLWRRRCRYRYQRRRSPSTAATARRRRCVR